MRDITNFNVLSHELKAIQGQNGHSNGLQEPEHGPQTFWGRLLPYGRRMRMTQDAKGVFIPYPLLGIVITLCTILVGGIIAIQVQVSNLSTTILLRDADQRAEIQSLKEKTEQLQVYIQNDREKLVRIEAQQERDSDNDRRR